jgi:hypothetical protein
VTIRPEPRQHRGVGPPLRWRTRRLEVVRRALPRNLPGLLLRRVGGLLRLHLLQHGRQPLVVEHLKPSAVPLNCTANRTSGRPGSRPDHPLVPTAEARLVPPSEVRSELDLLAEHAKRQIMQDWRETRRFASTARAEARRPAC